MNKQKYGLDSTYTKSLRLPKPQTSKREVVLSVDQIFNAKSNFTVVEKLTRLESLKHALERKIIRIARKRHALAVRKACKPLKQVIVIERVLSENPEREVEYAYVETIDLE